MGCRSLRSFQHGFSEKLIMWLERSRTSSTVRPSGGLSVSQKCKFIFKYMLQEFTINRVLSVPIVKYGIGRISLRKI